MQMYQTHAAKLMLFPWQQNNKTAIRRYHQDWQQRNELETTGRR